MTDDELVYVRELSAARHVVFACMTEPGHLAAFWGPEGTTTPLDGVVVELHAGGRFETLMVNNDDGSRYRMEALFDRVEPPDLLSWTEIHTGMSTTVTFRDTGPGRTEMHIRQRRVPAGFGSPEARAGFASSLDRIERYLRVIHEGRHLMDLQMLVGDSYTRLADALEQAAPEIWDSPSLCVGWRVREVIAHVTMPARLTDDQFGAAMAAANGDFRTLSDTVAARDSELPISDHLANLRSATLAAWQPPGGGAIGALNHAVVHGLDVTNAVNLPPACSTEAACVILDSLTTGNLASHFGVNLSGLRLETTDLDWAWGIGQPIQFTFAELISLACHRTLPAGQALMAEPDRPLTHAQQLDDAGEHTVQ